VSDNPVASRSASKCWATLSLHTPQRHNGDHVVVAPFRHDLGRRALRLFAQSGHVSAPDGFGPSVTYRRRARATFEHGR
jgi:hypothetical protein